MFFSSLLYRGIEMDVQQRRRLFELGESVIAEAILDALREAPEPLPTGQVVEALGLPATRVRISPHIQSDISSAIF